MGRSISSTDLRSGYRWCPHCEGWTVCKCGTCGTVLRNPAGNETLNEGVCKVCRGTGQIPDNPPSSAY
jgi:hypothetical protein